MIPAASFDVSNGTGYDVFQYFCEYYNTGNPHTAKKLFINASSTYSLGELDREPVDTLISTPGQGRWVSDNIENSSITIDFLKNKFNLVGYTFATPRSHRYIQNWNIYGIFKDRMYLLDSQRDSPLCSTPTSQNRCQIDDEKSFTVKNPGCFQKFRIVHIGFDSLLSYHFSLSGIKFYGSINPIFNCPTFLHKNIQLHSLSLLFIIVLI